MLCGVDIETGGLSEFKNSIMSIGIVPLDEHYEPHSKIKPFYSEIYNKDFGDPDLGALKVNKLYNYQNFPDYKAVFLEFYKWWDLNKIGPIMAIGHNFANFDVGFVKFWLGINYREIFYRHIRDTQILGQVLMDCGLYSGSISLEAMCKSFEINYGNHNALEDAISSARLYKKIIDRLKNN